MTPAQFIEITRDGIYVLILTGAAPMIVALIVGLVISLFQALTQIQEATLTFVPKIVALLLTLALTLPFMVTQLTDYTNRIAERISGIE